MRVDFRSLPHGMDEVPRPLVDIEIEGMGPITIVCLTDTGSLHNRFGMWVARLAGIDLSDAESTRIGVGGRPVRARTTVTRLRFGEASWEAPVSFCEPWPWDFQLLGQEGFFRWFRVVFDAAERRMEITPNA